MTEKKRRVLLSTGGGTADVLGLHGIEKIPIGNIGYDEALKTLDVETPTAEDYQRARQLRKLAGGPKIIFEGITLEEISQTIAEGRHG